ncbi:diguanylate cyclase [Candidatus Bipolaricaulota bacterium]|nr:diguanylate cyclase [Candidatus Bipolaricaulota bacterium]
MNQDPKGTILVRTSAAQSECPVWQKLNSLGYETALLSSAELSAKPNRPIRAVVLNVLDQDQSEIEATIAQIRETKDAPILLVDNTRGTGLSYFPDPDLGITRIPGTFSDEELHWAISCACEVHRLHSQLTHYRELLESAPLGVFELTNGRVSYANDYLLERIGYELAELKGLEVESLFTPADRPRLLQAMRDLPFRPAGAPPPNTYRLLTSDHRVLVGEIRSRIISHSHPLRIEGTIRDITEETRIEQLHRIVLELTEVILAEQNIDRILQLVLDTIVEHSGFGRALLSLYDLSIPNPFEGPIYKIMTSGLTDEEQRAVFSQTPMDIVQRKQVFANEFTLGSAQYIPHDRTPWSDAVGISGTVAIEGWHPDDYLFIPLRGADGIIGIISVDDPIDQTAPTVASIEPVAFLARFAAIAVERVFKLNQLKKQAEQLHGLSVLGRDLALTTNERELCEIASHRVCYDMHFEFCGIWLNDSARLVLEAVAQNGSFPEGELPQKGTRNPVEGLGLTRMAFKTGEAIVVGDAHEDTRYNGIRGAIRSFIAVPIPGRKGILGVIDVASQRVAAFGSQDVEILSALASQLSTAISGLRRQASLSRIYEFGQHLAVAATEERAISSTLEFLASQFDFHISSILLMNGEDSLRIAGLHGSYERDALALGQTFRLGEGIAGHAAMIRRYAIVPDVRENPHYIEVSASTRSELAVPILFSGNLLGAINTESPTVNFFDDEDRRLIEVVATHLAIALSNISSQATLREQAIRDPLTGLFNRHYFNSIIASELGRSDRYAHPLSLMMIDVDGFRSVNNRMGHLTGDVVLQNVARMLSSAVRDSDRVIRYGGDEFLIVMPETDGHAAANLIAERLRKEVASVLEGTDAKHLGLTLGLSIGIYSRLPGQTETMEEILEEVDRRMYADKREQNKDHANDYRH